MPIIIIIMKLEEGIINRVDIYVNPWEREPQRYKTNEFVHPEINGIKVRMKIVFIEVIHFESDSLVHVYVVPDGGTDDMRHWISHRGKIDTILHDALSPDGEAILEHNKRRNDADRDKQGKPSN